MKRFQPYYYIVALAALFLLAGTALFVMQLFPTAESSGLTVEPQTNGQGETLYDLWFTSVGIHDITVDHALNAILFSAENNTVNLLDRERKLLWEKVFATDPVLAKISADGSHVAVGTTGGRLFLTSIDQQTTWDHEGDPVTHLALSPSASWVVAARTDPEHNLHHLDLFSQSGRLNWSFETGVVENLFLTSEYLEQANIYYTEVVNEVPSIKAVGLDGRETWSRENQSLIAVSRHGSRLAAAQGNRLHVYDSLGYALWSTSLPFEPKTVIFNPQNYNRILVYGSSEGSVENLYYFDLAEDLIWIKRIADGSLFSFTADGLYVITSSWRHYKEDYTQMTLLDREGVEVNNWEVAMRVEHLLVAGHPYLVLVGGEDGFIDLLDLQPLISSGSNGVAENPVYSPVSTGVRADQARITLYFSDDNAGFIPVSRLISLTESPLRAALEELVRGPARGSELFRTIPDKDASIEVAFDDATGQLYLDLSPEMLNVNGVTQSEAALYSILKTLGEFKGVEKVYLTLEREPLDRFGSLDLELPLEPLRFKKPLYIPALSGNRYYLAVVEGSSGESMEEVAATSLETLFEHLLRSGRSLQLVPAGLELISINVTPEQVQINLNSAFTELFPEESTEITRLKATLMLDALFLTAFENSRRQRAEILIDGEAWSPPEGYPPLNRFYRQPFFLNPE